MRRLLTADDPAGIRVDPAHTWAINGIGKDLCGSAIVLQARAGLFGTGSIAKRLERAYELFDAYLARVGKHSSIEDFLHGTLKCKKTLLSCHWLPGFLI